MSRMFIRVVVLSATSATNRASCARGRVVLAADRAPEGGSLGVSVGGHALGEQPQAERVAGAVVGRRLLPTMSLVNMPCTSAPASLNCCASERRAVEALLLARDGREDQRASGRWVAITRASSIETATPDASSSAPGASAVRFMTSVTRES